MTFKAIYKDGVLRPIEPVAGLPEDRPVEVSVSVETTSHPLAKSFGILPDEDAAEMLAIIESEFEKVDLDEWK